MDCKPNHCGAYETAAKSAAEANDYIGALGYYRIIIEEAGDKKLSNYYQAAEAARKGKSFNYAASYYQYVLNNDQEQAYPESEYWLAYMQKSQGNYIAASKSFEQFIAKNQGADAAKLKIATDEVETRKWAAKVVEQADGTEITQLNTDINTGYADFAPVFHDDVLYYTSVRYASDVVGEGKILARLMAADDAEYGVSLKGNVNSNTEHVANAAFNQDGTMMYYTICQSDEVENNCAIYSRTKDGSDFGDAVKLSNTINKKGANNTQPNFAVDTKGNEYLFFSSNRKRWKRRNGYLDVKIERSG